MKEWSLNLQSCFILGKVQSHLVFVGITIRYHPVRKTTITSPWPSILITFPCTEGRQPETLKRSLFIYGESFPGKIYVCNKYTSFQLCSKSTAQIVIPGMKKMAALQKSEIGPEICMSVLQAFRTGYMQPKVAHRNGRYQSWVPATEKKSHQEGTFPNNELFDTVLSLGYMGCVHYFLSFYPHNSSLLNHTVSSRRPRVLLHHFKNFGLKMLTVYNFTQRVMF